mmetsp:Transcript_16891/g.19325  ORF Transcript_16891/g.19325 Transcript_16891/m.19325 type:complete len:303 (+) Transcript_16891:10-918(+)
MNHKPDTHKKSFTMHAHQPWWPERNINEKRGFQTQVNGQYLSPMTESQLKDPSIKALLAATKDIFDSISWLQINRNYEDTAKKYNEILGELYDVWNDRSFLSPCKSMLDSSKKIVGESKSKISYNKTKLIDKVSNEKNSDIKDRQPDAADVSIVKELHMIAPRKKLCRNRSSNQLAKSKEQNSNENLDAEFEIIPVNSSLLEPVLISDGVQDCENSFSNMQEKEISSEDQSLFRVSKVGDLKPSPTRPELEPKSTKITGDRETGSETKEPLGRNLGPEKFTYNYEKSMLSINMQFKIDPTMI